jgi:hypothetical protein
VIVESRTPENQDFPESMLALQSPNHPQDFSVSHLKIAEPRSLFINLAALG